MSYCIFVQQQVYDVESGQMVANTSHHTSPENISITRLPTGSSFRVAVFAVNVKGVSAPHVIMAQTMRVAEKYIGELRLRVNLVAEFTPGISSEEVYPEIPRLRKFLAEDRSIPREHC